MSSLLARSFALGVALATCTGGMARADVIDECRPTDNPTADEDLLKVEKLISKGRAAQALGLIEDALRTHPKDARALYLQARIEMRTGKAKKAVGTLQSAQLLDPQCLPVVGVLGELLEARRTPGEAAEVYKQALETHGGDLELRHKYAHALVASGKLEDAEPELRRLRDEAPGDAEAHAAWAEVQEWRGKHEDAITGFEAARALKPNFLTVARLLTYADAMRQAHRVKEAHGLYEQVLRKSPENTGALSGMGYLYMDMAQPGDAVGWFQRAIRSNPKDGTLQAGLARALTADKRQAEAVEPYERAVRALPNDKELRLEAAQVIASQPRHRDEAIAILEPIATGPGAEDRYVIGLGTILSWMPDKRMKALEVFEPLMNREPPVQAAWQAARQTLLWMGANPDAMPWIERLLLFYPGDRPLMRVRADTLARLPGRERDALEAYTRLLADAPEDGIVRVSRAELALKLNPRDETQGAELRHGAELAASSADIQFRAGVGLASLSRLEDALVCFNRGLEVDPQHLPCISAKADTLAALGRPDEAKAFLEQAQARFKDRETRDGLKRQQVDLKDRAERQQAAKLAGEGKLSEAEALYRALLNNNPRDVNAWVSLGAIQSRNGNFEAALESFQKALRIDPKQIGALQGISGSLVALYRLAEAKEYINKEIELAPSPDAQRRLSEIEVREELDEARKSFNNTHSDAALDRLTRLYLKAPGSATVANVYGEALLYLKRYPEAAEIYQHALSVQPDSVDAMRGAATSLWGAGQRVKARELLMRARGLVKPTARKEIDRQLLSWEVEQAEEAKKRNDLRAALERYREAYHIAPEEAYVLKGVGGLYWSNRQLDLASKFYVRAANLHPGDMEAVSSAMEILLARDMPDQALALVDVSPRKVPAQLADLVERARVMRALDTIEGAWRRGDRALAERQASELAEQYPRRVEPWMRLASLAGQQGEYLEALRWYHRALATDSSNQNALLAMIATLQTMGRHEEAVDLIRQARVMDGTIGRVTPELDALEATSLAVDAQKLRKKGDLQGALELYARALKIQPGAGWILQTMAGIYEGNHQPAQALELYQLELDLNPLDEAALKGKARTLLQLERANDAEPVVGRILQGDSGQSDNAQILRAELLKAQGDRDGALALYLMMHSRSPDDLDVSKGLVGVYLALGRQEDALSLLNELLSQHENDPQLLQTAAATLSAMGRNDLAVPILRKLDRYWPGNDTRVQLDNAYLAATIEAAEAAKARNDLKAARQLYEEARRRSPDSVEVLKGLGGVEASAGNADQARELFSQALAVSPDDPVAIVGHASTRAASGEMIRATEELDEGWDRTRAARVGIEEAGWLIDQHRYAEANRTLKDVEAVLDEKAEKEKMPRRRAGDTDPARSGQEVEQFQQTWRVVARHVPTVQASRPRTQLSARFIPRYTANPSTAGAVEAAPSVSAELLPDIAPELPTPQPIGAGFVQGSVATATPGHLDLWPVEKLLADPSMAMAGDDRNVEQDRGAPRSIVEFSQDEPTPDGDEYAPWHPTAARAPINRGAVSKFDPEKRLVELNADLAEASSARLHVGLVLDQRSGSVRTTSTGSKVANQLFSGFGDVRLAVYPTHAIFLEPYFMPGLATNGLDTQQGAMAGVNIGIQPGLFSLTGGVGASPIGFVGGTYVVGRARADFRMVDRFQLGVEGAVEPVTDSLVSWAGQIDPASNTVFGRVSRARLGANATLMLDARTSLSAGGDVGRYSGLKLAVASNRWRQGRANIEHTIPLEDKASMLLGLDLTVFGFEHQLDGLTLGQGGYFSPRLFVVTKLRGQYRGIAQGGQIHYRAMLALGVQYTDGTETLYLAPGTRGVVGAELEATYRLGLGLDLGARYMLDFVGTGGTSGGSSFSDYNRQVGMIFLEKRFGVDREPARRP